MTTSHRDLSKTVSATKNLRAISMSLVKKVRSKPTISSVELANQLAYEAVHDVLGTAPVSPTDLTAIEKNIRRRLYDSLKVLESIGAIARTKKDKSLTWQGVRHLIPPQFQTESTPPCSPLRRDSISKSIANARERLANKHAQRIQLDAQTHALASLCTRNRVMPAPDAVRIQMPFVLIRTPVHTEIRLNATPDAKRISFEFEGCYELVNDASILDRIFVVGSPKRDRGNGHVAFKKYAVSAKRPPLYGSPLRLRVGSPVRPLRKRLDGWGKRVLAPREGEMS